MILARICLSSADPNDAVPRSAATLGIATCNLTPSCCIVTATSKVTTPGSASAPANNPEQPPDTASRSELALSSCINDTSRGPVSVRQTTRIGIWDAPRHTVAGEQNLLASWYLRLLGRQYPAPFPNLRSTGLGLHQQKTRKRPTLSPFLFLQVSQSQRPETA